MENTVIQIQELLNSHSQVKDKKIARRKLDKIKMELKKRGIQMNLYLGNEIYISENINNLLKDGIVSSMADSDYVLVELPINAELKRWEELINRIIHIGKKVIIAHPERYIYVQKNIKYFEKLRATGRVYLQGNFGSIIGRYGKEAQKVIIKLIKEKKIDVLATDIHRNNSYRKIPEIMLKLKTYQILILLKLVKTLELVMA